MTIAQIESNLRELIENFTPHTFAFDLLLAYGSPKAAIARLEKGDLNQLDLAIKRCYRARAFESDEDIFLGFMKR